MMEFKCMWNTEPVTECPPVQELNRLRADVRRLEEENRWLEEENRKLGKYQMAVERMGKFGELFLPTEGGDPPGPMGMPGTGTLERAALAMGTITDTRGEDWVPVQKCVLKDLFQNIRDLQRRAAEAFQEKDPSPVCAPVRDDREETK